MSNWRKLSRAVIDGLKKVYGETITYTPEGGTGDPIEIEAMIDEAYEAVQPNTGAVVIEQQPMICVKMLDLPVPPQKDDLVTMRGQDYKVIDCQTDGQAAYDLFLHLVD